MVNILLVGEAYGEKEEELGKPFVGTSGWILDQMLAQVGINRKECYLTNVFNLRPRPSNDVGNLCGTKAEGIPGMPYLQRGKYVKAKYASELERLYSEIRREEPNIIIALGATAAWALLHSSGIKAIRGASTATPPSVSNCLGRTYKVLPTFHPAAIARDWSTRPIGLSDLDKALAESSFPEVIRPSRKIWIRPTLEDIARYETLYIRPAKILSADIETKGNQITCIGFAPSAESAIVIPFWSAAQTDGNYWRTKDEELQAWNFVRRWCTAPLLFQNGMYDAHVLWRSYGIPCPNMIEDTMLLHHALQPEMEKGLGFLATLYTNEASWKFMRKASEVRKHD